jgi:hypothetical protein
MRSNKKTVCRLRLKACNPLTMRASAGLELVWQQQAVIEAEIKEGGTRRCAAFLIEDARGAYGQGCRKPS